MRKALFKYYIIFGLLVLRSPLFFGQNFLTHLYTTADGLSDNYILSIYQDSYGYIWIGTNNGLNRFDGKRFTCYRLGNGLPSLSVDRIYEDRRHRLWIGTRAGMAELKGDSCYTYPVEDNLSISFVSGFLEPDSLTLWASTNKGLYEFVNNTWKKVKLIPGYENASIGKIIKTKNNLYVNYENKKLIQIDNNKKVNYLFSSESPSPSFNNFFAQGDSIYISTYSSMLSWQHSKWISLFADSLQKKLIYTSFRDKNMNWWFGTKQDGVLVVAKKVNKVVYSRISLPFNLVSNFFEDRDGNIWVAGFQGLLKVRPADYKMISLPELNKMNFIRNSIGLPFNKILVSGDNGQLLILGQEETTASTHPLLSVLSLDDKSDFIDHYAFDEKQRMWFTTRNNHLYRLEGSSLKDFCHIVVAPNKIFRDLAYNKKTKELFVCGDSVLLWGNEKKLDTFFSRNKKFIPLPVVTRLREDDGSLLVQTLGHGMFYISPEKQISAAGKDLNFSHCFMDNYPNVNNQLHIWVVNQGKSIALYNWEKGKLPRLTETIARNEGFPEHFIQSLATDPQGRLWIASSSGIRVLKKNFNQQWIQQDLLINTLNYPAPFSFSKLLCRGNNILVSVQNQLLVFDISNIPVKPARLNTVIEKILLFDKPTNWSSFSDSLFSYRQLPVNPVLKYNQNTLSILFNGPQFITNSAIEYSYRLLPVDTAWSSPSEGKTVNFYQLNPGVYSFQVKSHTGGGEWSAPEIFSFKIRAPFWEAWWFRLLMIAAGASILIFIFRYRIRQLNTKNQLQLRLRELETKAFKLQMNPHFIHNALNSIQSLVINNKSKEAGSYISKFAKLLRQVLENSDKNLVPLEKELNSLQLYIDLEKLRMNMDVEYMVHLDESITESSVSIPPLILQPLIENALWHGLSRKTGAKKIILSARKEQNWIIYEITDNGIGRRKAAENYSIFPEGHLSKAIEIIKQRLANFNQLPGTESLSYIDHKENGEATGTTAIIRIRVQ